MVKSNLLYSKGPSEAPAEGVCVYALNYWYGYDWISEDSAKPFFDHCNLIS